jgi:hypothetical protein
MHVMKDGEQEHQILYGAASPLNYWSMGRHRYGQTDNKSGKTIHKIIYALIVFYIHFIASLQE